MSSLCDWCIDLFDLPLVCTTNSNARRFCLRGEMLAGLLQINCPNLCPWHVVFAIIRINLQLLEGIRSLRPFQFSKLSWLLPVIYWIWKIWICNQPRRNNVWCILSTSCFAHSMQYLQIPFIYLQFYYVIFLKWWIEIYICKCTIFYALFIYQIVRSF